MNAGLNKILLDLLTEYDIKTQSIGIVNGNRSTWLHLKKKPKVSQPFGEYQDEIFYFEVNSYITYLAPCIAEWVKQNALEETLPKKNFGLSKKR